MARIHTVWEKSKSGVLVPGQIWDNSERRTSTVLTIRDEARSIENLYSEADVRLPPTCGLAKFIDKAKAVGDAWATRGDQGLPYADIFAVMHMMRLTQAILPLKNHPLRAQYLKRLTLGEVDFFKRIASDSKDTLWELETWSLLKSRNAGTDLRDPPDVVIPLSGGVLGLACKKIYSEKNVEKVLSQAVAQVKDFQVGLVAINIDELTPAETVLKVNTEAEMVQLLQQPCNEFIERHQRHLRKYLSTGRIIAALVAVHVIADVKEWKVPLNNSRQSVVWSVPGLSAEKDSLLRQFQQIIV